MSEERDYEVGKGKPPKAYQFKPGQSGNPAGARRHRPRKQNYTLRELAIAVANEPVTVTLNGRKVKVTKKEAIFIGVINDALTQDAAHRLRALRELGKLGAFNPAPHAPLSQSDAIHKFVERLAKEAEREREWERKHGR